MSVVLQSMQWSYCYAFEFCKWLDNGFQNFGACGDKSECF